MILGIVRGSIYSTVHHPVCNGKKLLIVDHIDAAGAPTGKYLIAVDSVNAGVGQQVLVLDEGNGARQVLADPTAPVRSIIVGIVDHIEQTT
jgi:microcompartment protein CcmK/EutM